MSSIIAVVYWVCWFPYAIVSFWQTFGDVADIPIVWSAVPAVAAKSQIVWNPVIYVATNKQFRTAFYDSLPCGGLREALVKREEVKEAESKVSELGDDKKKDDESKTKVKHAYYYIQSNLDISKLTGLFFTSSNTRSAN